MRTLALCLMVGLALLFCCPTIATASATASPPIGQLVPDPFLEAAEVTTSVHMAVRCPYPVILNCPYRDIGTDCAEQAGDCHCAGSDPALRKCVWSGN